MKLSVPKIPTQFARAVPRGFRLVKRQGRDVVLVESVFCPQGHNLIVDSVRIHGEPSVKLKIGASADSGFVFVDAFWGSHSKLFSFIPRAAGNEPLIADVYCPYCDASMNEERGCSEKGCGSQRSILLGLPGGKNAVHICARLGCPGHFLEIVELPEQVVRAVSGINFFGAGSDDVLGSI